MEYTVKKDNNQIIFIVLEKDWSLSWRRLPPYVEEKRAWAYVCISIKNDFHYLQSLMGPMGAGKSESFLSSLTRKTKEK